MRTKKNSISSRSLSFSRWLLIREFECSNKMKHRPKARFSRFDVISQNTYTNAMYMGEKQNIIIFAVVFFSPHSSNPIQSISAIHPSSFVCYNNNNNNHEIRPVLLYGICVVVDFDSNVFYSFFFFCFCFNINNICMCLWCICCECTNVFIVLCIKIGRQNRLLYI